MSTDITVVFGHNSHQGDLVEELSVPIYYHLLKDGEESVYMGLHPNIRTALLENKKYSHAMLTLRGIGILFFRQQDGEWIVE